MFLRTLIPSALLTFVAATAVSAQPDNDVITGEFLIQPYTLPDDQGYRHMTAVVVEDNEELIVFGGLGDGPPAVPTPMNHLVYALDLTTAVPAQDWQQREEAPVLQSWYTSTRGFAEIDGHYYLACDDSNVNTVYTFNPDTYEVAPLSTSTLSMDIDAGDCCAVGVKITNSRGGHQNGEERIYILGGRNDVKSPVEYARYYSVTNDEWVQVADMNIGRSHLGCVAAEQRGTPMIYAVGGGNSPAGEVLRSVEVYDVFDDSWTLHDNVLPEGRTRLGVQNLDNKRLLLIGGDSTCAGGGPNNQCAADQPLDAVDLIDIQHGITFISSADYGIPQLKIPRQAPATALRKRQGNNQDPRYVLYVIGGRSRDAQGTNVLTSTEVLSFDRIRVENLPH